MTKQTSEMTANYLTIKEVAAILQVSQATVRNWIKRNLLRAATIGAVIRIRRTDLELLVNRNSLLNTNHAPRTKRGHYSRQASA